MNEITDKDLASIYSNLSSCSPLVRGLAERLRRLERENEGLTLSALQSQRQADALLKKLHAAERERDEAYAKGLERAAGIVEGEGLDNCSCVDGEKCESCYTVDDILERLKAERP